MIKILWKKDYKKKLEYTEELEKSEDLLEKEVGSQRHQINSLKKTIQSMEQDYIELENLNKVYLKALRDKDNFKKSNTEMKARVGGLTASKLKNQKEILELEKKIEIQAKKIQELLKKQVHTVHEYAHDGQPKHLKDTKKKMKGEK